MSHFQYEHDGGDDDADDEDDGTYIPWVIYNSHSLYDKDVYYILYINIDRYITSISSAFISNSGDMGHDVQGGQAHSRDWWFAESMPLQVHACMHHNLCNIYKIEKGLLVSTKNHDHSDDQPLVCGFAEGTF